MAATGKKINELTAISTVTNDTVLPSIYVQGQTTATNATKISVGQISDKVVNNMSTILAGKQDVLTAGTGIDITNNVISATSSGGGISFADLVADGTTYTTITKEQEFIAPSAGWICPQTHGSTDSDIYIWIYTGDSYRDGARAATAGGTAFVNTGTKVYISGVSTWDVRFYPCVGAL